jgi:DNA-binding PadR family transcriptional regulator
VRTDILQALILGLLIDGPTHGYELRKRLALTLGPLRALSFGSLYGNLKRLERAEFVERQTASVGRRSKVVYAITDAGRGYFQKWIDGQSPADWDDEGFAARLTFFSRTEARVRLRILEGRRARLEERLALLSRSLDASRASHDIYVQHLQRHGVEGTEREVHWIDELIAAERLRGSHG